MIKYEFVECVHIFLAPTIRLTFHSFGLVDLRAGMLSCFVRVLHTKKRKFSLPLVYNARELDVITLNTICNIHYV